jgi:hypothetical protein
MSLRPLLCTIALSIGIVSPFSSSTTVRGQEAPCPAQAYVTDEFVDVTNDAPSWIFSHSTYSHDPYTGARVAQYMRTPPVEPLDDQRWVTSRYRRSRTNLRGTNGSFDSYYQVQAWGNGRGGIDAEWERFHNAWKESILSGGYYQSPGGPWGYGGGFPPGGYGPGFGFGFPGGGFPAHGGYGPPHGPWKHGDHGDKSNAGKHD